MLNLARETGAKGLFVKRDDCTGLAFGGNKVRQLEFYLGEALADKADTILITGAVQSNFVRTAAAAASRLGLACHVQLESRVKRADDVYLRSGNVLLDRLFGAQLHYYPDGEDEAGADRQVREIAANVTRAGGTPYVIPLAAGPAPVGALGYVLAAGELLEQLHSERIPIDEIVVASGSGHTHAGLLFGLRAHGSDIAVTGVCVRRDARAQRRRIRARCSEIADLLGMHSPVESSDIVLTDRFLPPGYGQVNPGTLNALSCSARLEGLLLDPVYTGKAMAALIQRAVASRGSLMFVHTGGIPALFAYEQFLSETFSRPKLKVK